MRNGIASLDREGVRDYVDVDGAVGIVPSGFRHVLMVYEAVLEHGMHRFLGLVFVFQRIP